MLISDELIYEVLEYARNKMVASVSPTDLLVIHDWSIVHRIVDPQPGNVQKYELLRFPNFDLATFPFILCRGHESINLVNVKEM